MKGTYKIFVLYFILLMNSQIKTQTAEDYFNQGIKLNESENWHKARELFDRAIELNPNFTSAYYERATWLIRYSKDRDDLKRAIEDLNKVLKLDTTFKEAYYHRALVKLKLNPKDENGVKDLVEYQKFNDIYYDNTMYELIEVRWKQKEYDALINELEYLYNYHNKDVKYNLGILYTDYLFKEYNHALHVVNNLLNNQSSSDLFIGRSNIYAKLGRFYESIADIDSAFLLIQTENNKNEKIKNLMLIKAMNLNELNHYQEASEIIYKNLLGIISPDYENYKFICELAISKYGLKDYSEALTTINRMINFFTEEPIDNERMMKMFIYRALTKKEFKNDRYSSTDVCEDFRSAIKLSEEYLLPVGNYPQLEAICNK